MRRPRYLKGEGVNNYPLELTKWIAAIKGSRPEHERLDARDALESWIQQNVKESDQAAYRQYCIQRLTEVLDGER